MLVVYSTVVFHYSCDVGCFSYSTVVFNHDCECWSCFLMLCFITIVMLGVLNILLFRVVSCIVLLCFTVDMMLLTV